MKAVVDWAVIQVEYEKGVKPQEIAEKFENITAKQISDKAYLEKWKQKKEERKSKTLEKTRKKYETKIDKLLKQSFVVLTEILNNDLAKDSDKINAVKCVLDISGLKKETQEVTQKEINISVANLDDKELIEGV